ncbi:permease family-domain-containing protein [Haematococcus lacustris]
MFQNLEFTGDQLNNWQRLDIKLTRSWVGRYFECEERFTTVLQELWAGLVCFLTVCYIIPVNAGILADTGGSCDARTDCSAEGWAEAAAGNDGDGSRCRFTDDKFASCVMAFKNNAIASTCIVSMISTFLMAVVARMPLAVAPAMGLNAYFTYNVVGYLGSDNVSYSQALAAVFVEGLIFLFLSITGIRGRLMELVPKNIMYATGAGIGCYLAFIGLQHAEGIALITFDPSNLVTIGGCPPDEREYMYSISNDALTFENICEVSNNSGKLEWVGVNAMGPPSPNYRCSGKQVTSATTWLGIMTGGLMVSLMMKEVKAPILLGILFCTFISWIPNHAATFFGDSSMHPGGQARYDYFRKGALAPDISRTAGQLDFTALDTSSVWVALITFLYLDFLDATTTMYAMARLLAEDVHGFVNEKGKWKRQLLTMCVDGVGIVIGSLLGTSPVQVFAESAVGIREGGRTGITAFVVACGFGVSMFLSPIFASIPPFATGPAIVLVGAMMMEHCRYVHWADIRQAVPAFLTIVLMPLTNSIAYGLICGLGFTIFLWCMDTIFEVVLVLTGRYKGQKTLYHVWLDSMSQVYIALGKEETLRRDLPGFEPVEVLEVEADSHLQEAAADEARLMQLAQERAAELEAIHERRMAEERAKMAAVKAAHDAKIAKEEEEKRRKAELIRRKQMRKAASANAAAHASTMNGGDAQGPDSPPGKGRIPDPTRPGSPPSPSGPDSGQVPRKHSHGHGIALRHHVSLPHHRTPSSPRAGPSPASLSSQHSLAAEGSAGPSPVPGVGGLPQGHHPALHSVASHEVVLHLPLPPPGQAGLDPLQDGDDSAHTDPLSAFDEEGRGNSSPHTKP